MLLDMENDEVGGEIIYEYICIQYHTRDKIDILLFSPQLDGPTALMAAAKKARVEIVQLLIESGAQLDLKDQVIITKLGGGALFIFRGHISFSSFCPNRSSVFYRNYAQNNNI